jgi:hypothetical protein
MALLPVIDLFETSGLIAAPDVVIEGHYFGKVQDLTPEGIVTQKVNRDGLTVKHAVSSLSQPVAKGEVVEILYKNGSGTVVGRGVSNGVGR